MTIIVTRGQCHMRHISHLQQDDEFCCAKRLIDKSAKSGDSEEESYPSMSNRVKGSPLVHTTMKYYHHLINNMTRKLNPSQHTTGARPGSRQPDDRKRSQQLEITKTMLLVLVATLTLAADAITQRAYATIAQHHHNHHHNQHIRLKGAAALEQLPAQARVGGLDPSDYIDEAGELDVLINQQQIPTAQLMQAAGYTVPDNFFLPGGSVPAASLYAAQQQRYLQQQQHQLQQQQQQHAQSQQQQDALQQVASQVQARVVPAPARYHQNPRALELLMAAAEQQQQQQQQQHNQEVPVASHSGGLSQLIDFNGYNLASQPDSRDAGAQMDLAEFLNGAQGSNQQQHTAASMLAMYEHELLAAQQQQHHHHNQLQQQQYQHQGEHGNMVDHMAAMASNQQQQQQENTGENEHYQLASGSSAAMIGPDYQLIGSGSGSGQEYPSNNYESGKSSPLEQQIGASSHQYSQQQQHHQQGRSNNNNNNNNNRPFGLPTKSSDKEPPGMLKPSGNPKTISSPLVDFAANNLPKNTGLEKLAEKLPQHQTPTVFSFSSSKDPSEKVKAVNQKKRNVIRQAEQIAKLMIKSFNDKFGTTLGDQTDIPFLLSTLGPLGFAQNVLFDPTLLVSLLNTAEKTYFSDVLPAPAKQVIKPVLNIFRVPNKKRDKANLLNIISYVTSGGQTSSSVPSKHRQSFGIEKSSNKNNKHNR